MASAPLRPREEASAGGGSLGLVFLNMIMISSSRSSSIIIMIIIIIIIIVSVICIICMICIIVAEAEAWDFRARGFICNIMLYDVV